LSKLFSWLDVLFSGSKALRNISSFDNSERFDNVVELEECLPREFHYLGSNIFDPKALILFEFVFSGIGTIFRFLNV